MTKNLLDVIEIVENNNDFILLEFTGSRKDMILTGVLNGDEEMVRITKGENHVFTQYTKDGKHFSFNWGIGGHTIISEELERKKRAFISLVEDDLETSLLDTIKTNLPQSKADVKGANATFKLMHFEGNENICVHKNGRFYKHISNQYLFDMELEDKYETTQYVEEYQAPNGCLVNILVARGRK